MPLDNAEKANAALGGFQLGSSIFVAIQALPPKEGRKAADWGPVVGVAPGGALDEALKEYDDPVHNAVDLIPILGLDPNGNMGKLLAFADQVRRDIED